MAGSTWVRLDVGYFRNTKIRRAGTDAALLHLAAICRLGESGNGPGILPGDDVEMIAASVRIRRLGPVIEQLVKHGLWQKVDGGDWLIHDYDTTNGDRSPVVEARERLRQNRNTRRDPETGQFR